MVIVNTTSFISRRSMMSLTKKILFLGLCFLSVCTIVNAQPSEKSFKEAYKDYFMIGVAVNQRNISNPDQSALVIKEFSSMTAENDMKPISVHPEEGKWTWGRADSIANFCRKNGIKLRGHTLMWHNQMCDWMFYDKKHNLVKKEVLYARMREHIHTVVNRYKDIVYCWDVFNECIADGGRRPGAEDQPLRESTFYKICGSDEFIRKAFEYAREADPNALLFYNDYNECDPVKRDRIYKMIKDMKAAGVPIDGIGMQGHYNIYGPSEEDIEAAVSKYAEIVDHIHVTELDIRVNEEMGGQLRFSRNEGANVTNDQKLLQEAQYAAVFRVMRRHADKVDCVTFWNLSDRDSWLGVNNYPLPFDRDYKPKNVYKVIRDFIEVLDILQQHPESTVAGLLGGDSGFTYAATALEEQETVEDGSDKIITITGKGNYTGIVRGFYASPAFVDPDGGSGSGQAAAVYQAKRDLSCPTSIKPYIIRKVNPSIGTVPQSLRHWTISP